jgi:hypothetical protein
MTVRAKNHFRPRLEQLESRAQPGTLLVKSPGFIAPDISLVVPNDTGIPSVAAAGIDHVGSDVAAGVQTDSVGGSGWGNGPPGGNNAATSVPFKGSADAVVTDAQPGEDGLHLSITEAGQGTHLGAFTRAETLVVHADGTISGTGVFTAANGDQLFTTVTGGFTSPTTVAGTYLITGGTGRFAGASGSVPFTGVTADGIHVALTFDGAISM